MEEKYEEQVEEGEAPQKVQVQEREVGVPTTNPAKLVVINGEKQWSQVEDKSARKGRKLGKEVRE